MKLRQKACRAYGLSKNHFACMKADNPEKYAYIESFAGDAYIAYGEYLKEKAELLANLEEMYFDLLDRKQAHKFSVSLYDAGITKHPNTYSASSDKVIFRFENRLAKHDTHMRWKRVFAHYVGAFKQ